MAKKAHPNNSRATISNLRASTMSLTDQFSLREQGLTQKDVENYAKYETEWSLKPTSLHFGEFYDEYGLDDNTYEEWAKKYPLLGFNHEKAKARLGRRREKLAMFARKEGVDPTTLHFTLPLYEKTWMQMRNLGKQDAQELVKLRETVKEGDRPSITVVEIPVFTKTPEEVAMSVSQKNGYLKNAPNKYEERVSKES